MIKEELNPKTYMAIVTGKGLKKIGVVLNFYPGEDRRLGRSERSLGEFASRDEAYKRLLAHFKHVSIGLRSARKRKLGI